MCRRLRFGFILAAMTRSIDVTACNDESVPTLGRNLISLTALVLVVFLSTRPGIELEIFTLNIHYAYYREDTPRLQCSKP